MKKGENKMELENFLWGVWNAISAWPLLVLHVFTIWDKYPVYNVVRDSGWTGRLVPCSGSRRWGRSGGDRGAATGWPASLFAA